MASICYMLAFTYCCDQVLDKKQLKGERFLLAYRDVVLYGEKAWWQECEATGHIESTVRRQRQMRIVLG